MLQFQPIVKNSIEPDISLDIMKPSSTISDLNYIPLKKKQKVFINIKFFITIHDVQVIIINDECCRSLIMLTLKMITAIPRISQ